MRQNEFQHFLLKCSHSVGCDILWACKKCSLGNKLEGPSLKTNRLVSQKAQISVWLNLKEVSDCACCGQIEMSACDSTDIEVITRRQISNCRWQRSRLRSTSDNELVIVVLQGTVKHPAWQLLEEDDMTHSEYSNTPGHETALTTVNTSYSWFVCFNHSFNTNSLYYLSRIKRCEKGLFWT